MRLSDALLGTIQSKQSSFPITRSPLRVQAKRLKKYSTISGHKIISRINVSIPKRAPWYGGFWERLVGLSKNALKKILGRNKPIIGEFRALVAKVEAVLTDRPFDAPPSDFHDKKP